MFFLASVHSALLERLPGWEAALTTDAMSCQAWNKTIKAHGVSWSPDHHRNSCFFPKKAGLCVRNHGKGKWHCSEIAPWSNWPLRISIPTYAQPQAWTQRPTPDNIASLIWSGAREVHPSRQPLMRAAVSSSMVTVQKRLGLKLACMDNGQSKLLRLVGMVWAIRREALEVLSHPPKCSQCSCTYVASFFTCALLQLHMCAGCVQAHAPKILSWCSATIGDKTFKDISDTQNVGLGA